MNDEKLKTLYIFLFEPGYPIPWEALLLMGDPPFPPSKYPPQHYLLVVVHHS